MWSQQLPKKKTEFRRRSGRLKFGCVTNDENNSESNQQKDIIADKRIMTRHSMKRSKVTQEK